MSNQTHTSSQVDRLACLIIDDPLLRPRHGCLSYERLLEEMKEHNFFTELGFIPCNWRRSDTQVVRLFKEHPDFFGICVHGCNHTNSEFGSTDYNTLKQLSANSLHQMEQHKLLTSLDYDRVMVFPQGRFSRLAIKALKANGYWAAVNSTLCAVDGEAPPTDEHLTPATHYYEDFPLFLRRYPKDMLGINRDIEAGRPVLLTAHHKDFRDGYNMITDVVDDVNSRGRTVWTSLSKIVQYYSARIPQPPDRILEYSDAIGARRSHIWMRRRMSEFRDNFIERSESLEKSVNALRNLIRSK